VGLLRCYQRQGQDGQFEGAAKQLLDLLEDMDQTLPPDCETPLREVLNSRGGTSASATVRELLGRIQAS
jgi:hypothetical protein